MSEMELNRKVKVLKALKKKSSDIAVAIKQLEDEIEKGMLSMYSEISAEVHLSAEE